jgi:hypothetical protein
MARKMGMGTLALLAGGGLAVWWFMRRGVAGSAIPMIPLSDLENVVSRSTSLPQQEVDILIASGVVPGDAQVVMLDPHAAVPVAAVPGEPGYYVVSPAEAPMGPQGEQGEAAIKGYRDYVQLGNVLYTGHGSASGKHLTTASGSASGTEGLWF